MTTKTEQPTIHKSVETVKTVKSMRTGWDISFAGRSNNAYLANSVEKIDDIGVGDLLDVSYHMDESSRGKFARIVELHSHTPADGSEKPAADVSESADESTDESAPESADESTDESAPESADESTDESAPESADESVKEFSATVKSLKATAAGLRLDLGYANGAFISYKTLKDAGVRIEQATRCPEPSRWTRTMRANSPASGP